jgi:hypothetical protein
VTLDTNCCQWCSWSQVSCQTSYLFPLFVPFMVLTSSLYYDHQNGEEDNYNHNNSWFMLENHVIVVCDTHDLCSSFVFVASGHIICAYIHMDGNYMIVVLNFFEFRKIILILK